MTATRCAGRPASPVHFLYHILSFTSGVMGQKGICRFEEYSLFRVASNLFCSEEVECVHLNVLIVVVVVKVVVVVA